MINRFTKSMMLPVFALSASFASQGFAAEKLTGKVNIDGSSTVFPITEAVAEEYRNVEPKVKVNVGVSGTGGGFKKFTVGEIDISNASRHMKDSEKEAATKGNVKYLEIPVAYDGLTVVVHHDNNWATEMTPADLKKIWDAGSTVKTWKDVNPKWPDRPIKLYGPGTDSGTFDYFTEAINGKSGQSRSDFQKSEDDNVLVSGVAGDKDSLGFFGYAYYKENKKKIKAVAINNGKGAILPDEKTINDGTYAPLSRPVFIYVNTDAYKKNSAVKSFVDFYLQSVGELSKAVGYINLPQAKYDESKTNLKKI